MLSLSSLLWLMLVAWFALLAACELVKERRGEARQPVSNTRLVTNFGLAALVLAAGAVLPISRVGSSALAAELGIGIGRHAHLSWFALFLLAFVADGLASYWVHRLMHAQPLLWRVHRVHHADTAVDVSTSLRNHPLELLVTAPVAAAAVLFIGAPTSAIIAVQSLSVAAAMWQHADISLPSRLDSAFARLIVTPRLHRLHHSPDRLIHDSNFGELITLWDRLFGTLNLSGEAGPVGLQDHAGSADRLLPQIWSPLRA